MYNDAPYVCVSIGAIKLTLNAGEIIVIMVDTSRSSEIRALDVSGRVASAIALRPLLVALDTG